MTASVEGASSTSKVFGARLKHYRKAMQLKQEVIAQAIGCSKSTISEIENGKHPPHLDNAVAIADFFGLSLDALVKEEVQHTHVVTMARTSQALGMVCAECRAKLIPLLRAIADDFEQTLDEDGSKTSERNLLPQILYACLS
jgi:transcriptional regulator with XRE-family HTH domain